MGHIFEILILYLINFEVLQEARNPITHSEMRIRSSSEIKVIRNRDLKPSYTISKHYFPTNCDATIL